MNNTKKLTIAAIFSALGTVFLYMGSLIELLDLSFALLASLIIVFADEELHRPYQYLMYAVTSIISLLILPDKYIAVVYALLGGLYPLLRVYIQKIRLPVIRGAVKLLCFNALFAVIFVVSKYVLGIQEDSQYAEIALFALGNLTFIVYDLLLGRLIILYNIKIRKRISRFLK